MLLYLISFLAIVVGKTQGLQSVRHARIVGRDTTLRSSYDFVVIGGGASGLTVADRITENPDSKTSTSGEVCRGPLTFWGSFCARHRVWASR